jgi:hypothetical protein
VEEYKLKKLQAEELLANADIEFEEDSDEYQPRNSGA